MGRLFDLNGGNKGQAVSINETARFVRSLSEDNKVPGHPPEALLRGRVGFLFTAAFLVFLAASAGTRVVSARLLFDTNSL